MDLKEMFKRFDKNGDGVFSYLEFECIFTVLDIQFAKDDLRKLINMTDSNKDGRIDMNEFHTMLYATDMTVEDDQESVQIVEEDSDESDSEEESKKQPARRVGAGGRASTGIPMSEKLRKLSEQSGNKPTVMVEQEKIEEDIEEYIPNEPIEEEEIEESMPHE